MAVRSARSNVALLLTVFGLIFLGTGPVLSVEQLDYKKIIKEDFWGQLYRNGGFTFYTKKPFTTNGPLVTESHIYSTSWIRDHLHCGTNRQCKRESPEYIRIISDLHNIVVADSSFAFKIKKSIFGPLDDSIDADKYGIRKKIHIVEPTDDVKGDIARTIFYMRDTYNLPMLGNPIDLARWHKQDPPNKKELLRNDLIEKLQGTRNPLIDRPEQLDPKAN